MEQSFYLYSFPPHQSYEGFNSEPPNLASASDFPFPIVSHVDSLGNDTHNFTGISQPEAEVELTITGEGKEATKKSKKTLSKYLIWTEEKDEYLRSLVSTYKNKWVCIASIMAIRFPGFTPNRKQCKKHWNNSARPGLNKGEWSDLELALLKQKYCTYGTSWCKYQADFPDRSQAMIKSRCESLYGRVSRPGRTSPPLHAGGLQPDSPVLSQKPNPEVLARTVRQISGINSILIPGYTLPTLQLGNNEQVIEAQTTAFVQGIDPERESLSSGNRVGNYTKRIFNEISTPEEATPLLKKRKTKPLKTKLGIKTWTIEQDILLQSLVHECGRQWTIIAKKIALQFEDFDFSNRQCRERWDNHVNPQLKKGRWTEEEKSLLKEKFMVYGTSWRCYQNDFPGRTLYEIKNMWISINQRLNKSIASRFVPASFPEEGILDDDLPPPLLLQSEIITPAEQVVSEVDKFDILSFLT